jgi:hypothetical protein
LFFSSIISPIFNFYFCLCGRKVETTRNFYDTRGAKTMADSKLVKAQVETVDGVVADFLLRGMQRAVSGLVFGRWKPDYSDGHVPVRRVIFKSTEDMEAAGYALATDRKTSDFTVEVRASQ